MDIYILVNYMGKFCTCALFSYHHLLTNPYVPHCVHILNHALVTDSTHFGVHWHDT